MPRYIQISNLRKCCFFAITALFIFTNLSGSGFRQDTSLVQIWESGLPLITSFNSGDYKAHAQNWGFIQGNNGIIYVGNTTGILEFDGVSWRLIEIPNGSPAKSFAKSEDGVIYVGGVRDLGYLAPDPVGQMKFHTLLPHLDTVYQNFSDIWFTYAIGDAAYFISDDYIFKWSQNRFQVWEAEKGFGFAGQVNDRIYITQKGVGLMCLQNDSLTLIPDGDKFLNSKSSITTFLPYGDDKILMGHFHEGLFLYDHHKIEPFRRGENHLLQEKYIYNGHVLPNGNFLFTTHGEGCFIVDKNGNIVQWLSKKSGLVSNVVIGCYVDHEYNLWLATESGINRVEISSPLRIFGPHQGLLEGTDRVVFHNDKFYAATKHGLFYLRESSTDPEMKEFTFQKIDGINYQTWDIISKNDYLFAANFFGTYQIDPDHGVRRLILENTADLCPSLIDSNRVYAGTMTGKVFVMQFVDQQWQAEDSHISIDGRIIRMEENPDGSIWISTRYNGVYKLDWLPSNLHKSLDKEYTLKHFTTSDGLPEISHNIVYQVNGEVYFATRSGVYRFDNESQKFFKVTRLFKDTLEFDPGLNALMKESSEGGIWISGGSEFNNRLFKYNDGMIIEVSATKRISNLNIIDIYEYKGIVMVSGIQGIVGYNQQQGKNYSTSFPVVIRKVMTNNDSLLYGGHLSNEHLGSTLALPFTNNHLRFVYALPNYDNPTVNQYQYYLEGFDKDWSSWTTETQRDFTSLSEGKYTFRVKGMNIYGQISDEAIYSFTILPPWHRTWWAYLSYVLASAGLVGLIIRWQIRRLKREKEALEAIVVDRTSQLAYQADQLKEMDRQKSRFFANISHEFRTPLTLIKGPVENALQNPETSLSKEETIMIRNNADRLLRLVNQLLDLSKLDSNKMELTPSEGNIYSFLRSVASTFGSHAEHRNMRFEIKIPEDDLYLSFDHDRLEIILFNLLSNAFKFTPDKGVVKVTVHYKNEQLAIEVADTGIGIHEKHLDRIFDRFYQTDDSLVRETEGTGIGLALTKELIALMGGNIHVESVVGKGTKFIVGLPLAEIPNKHSAKAQINLRNAPYLTEDIPAYGINEVEEEKQDLPIVLIVEDNVDMRRFIGKQLKPTYKVIEAINGKSGLEKAQTEIPDIVITDLMMPQMDGMALCHKLKTDERTSHIPVVMLTAKAGQEQKVEGLETGADDYLTKPFDRKELLTRVKNLVQQRRLLREKFRKEINLQPRNISITSIDEKFLKKVEDVIEAKLSDEEFGVPQMQDLLMMSKTQLHRKMKGLTGHAPGEYIRNYRLKRAAQIITQKGDNVTQIAYSVGFSNLSYFAKSFKELFGVAPSQYRQSLTQKTEDFLP